MEVQHVEGVANNCPYRFCRVAMSFVSCIDRIANDCGMNDAAADVPEIDACNDVRISIQKSDEPRAYATLRICLTRANLRLLRFKRVERLVAQRFPRLEMRPITSVIREKCGGVPFRERIEREAFSFHLCVIA